MDLVYEYSADLTENLTDLSSKEGKIKLIQKYIKQTINAKSKPVPDLREGLEWFNVSQPLSFRKHLKDKLILLDFFTYCCINCLHVLPEIKKLEQKYTMEDGLVVVGVHSAKFEAEKLSKNVEAAVLRHEILHPVVNDGMVLWNQLQIACWPSLVLLGPDNTPLFILMGEGHTPTLDLMIEASLDYFKEKISKSSVPEISPRTHLAPSSGLLFPGRLAVHSGKLLVADSGHHRLLLIDASSGQVEAKIGCGDSGLADGSFQEAKFYFPQGVVFLNKDIAFVADTENHAIRMIDFQKCLVSTVVGNGKLGSDRVGGTVPANKQAISSPWGLSFDGKKRILFIAMAGSHQIWGYALNDTSIWKRDMKKGVCMALAGSGREENRNNSYPQVAAFAQPSGLDLCGAKSDFLLIADSESSSIRKICLDGGAVSGVVGGEKNPINLFAFGDKDGKGVEAKLQHPLDVCWSPDLNQAVAVDTFNSNLKLINIEKSSCETIVTLPEKIKLKEPGGICSDDTNKRLFVADTNNHLIKAIDLHTWKISEFPVVFACEVDSGLQYLKVVEKQIEVSVEEASIILATTVRFSGDTKASGDAPQTWTINLSEHMKSESSKGKLMLDNECRELSTSMKFEAKSTENNSKIIATFKIVTCGNGQCKMENLKAVVNIHRKADAPQRSDVDIVFDL